MRGELSSALALCVCAGRRRKSTSCCVGLSASTPPASPCAAASFHAQAPQPRAASARVRRRAADSRGRWERSPSVVGLKWRYPRGEVCPTSVGMAGAVRATLIGGCSRRWRCHSAGCSWSCALRDSAALTGISAGYGTVVSAHSWSCDLHLDTARDCRLLFTLLIYLYVYESYELRLRNARRRRYGGRRSAQPGGPPRRRVSVYETLKQHTVQQ